MSFQSLLKQISSPYWENVSLKNLTTFKIGGPCRLLIQLESIKDLQICLKYLWTKQIPWFFLGNGSNVLVSDEGFSGVILKLGQNFNFIDQEKSGIFSVGAATLLPRAVTHLSDNKAFSGLEWAASIPGSLGGAAYMNAGAFGSSLEKVLTKVNAVRYTGEYVSYHKSQLLFGYRYTDLKKHQVVVTSVDLSLSSSDFSKIQDNLYEYRQKRKSKQPSQPSVGSIFKNPSNISAGALIDECGFKGYQLGGAKISSRHANFIVNMGGASSHDVWTLIQEIKRKVRDRHNINLELEVETLGELA